MKSGRWRSRQQDTIGEPVLSPYDQASLLPTAPLIVGRGTLSSYLLFPGEYKRLARHLLELQRQPSDLLTPDAAECLAIANPSSIGRLRRLLGGDFQLSQVVERWQARAIWVVSRADPHYPRRLKAKLREDAPAVVKPDAPLESASVREPSPIYNSPEQRSALETGSVESEVALPKISDRNASDASPPPLLKPADTLFIAVREIARQVLTVPTKDVEFATALRISGPLAKTWLKRLVESRTVVADWRLILWGQKCKAHYTQPLASRLT